MESSEITPFGGIAGRIVRESIGPESFLSGLTLAIVAGLSAWWFHQFRADAAALFVLQLWPLLFLARFALNGSDGEWRGTIFSGRGGGLWDVARVAGRHLLLMILWCLPLALLLKSRWAGGGSLGGSLPLALMMGDRAILLLGAAYLIASALTPPVFLIGSVAAQRTWDLFLPPFWRQLFRRRFGDLLLIYAVYLGAILCVILPSLPVIVLLLGRSSGAGILMTLGLGAFALGFALNLLGRLCGFFTATCGEGGIPWSFAAREAIRPAPAGVPPRLAAPSAAPEDGGTIPLPLGPGHLGRITTPSGKGPLLDARETVMRIAELAESDPRRAVAELERLDSDFAPHPLVLHLLSRLKIKVGPEDEARAAAGRALQILLGRGHVRLAAEVYRDLRAVAPLGDPPCLRREDRLILAEAIREVGDTPAAIEIWRAILEEDPRERRALKALIQVSEGMMRGAGQAAEAASLLRFLLGIASDSPLRGAIEERLAEAERRTGRSERRSA